MPIVYRPKTKPEPTPDELPFVIHKLTDAEARYQEAVFNKEWRPQDVPTTAKAWRKLYFQAWRLMAPGQVYDDGYHVATRHEDRIEITVRARAERRAS